MDGYSHASEFPPWFEGSHIAKADWDHVKHCLKERDPLDPSIAKRLVTPLSVLHENVETVVRGKSERLKLIESALIIPQDQDGQRTMFIIEDTQGTAKTVAGEAYARSIAGAPYGRIQATGDMTPTMLTGHHERNRKTGEWEFVESNLFNVIVIFDDATRTPPKTSAAMLQPIAEGKITVGRETFSMPFPSVYIFTQNPTVMEGTYFQTEALRDRAVFVMRFGHPNVQATNELLEARVWEEPLNRLEPVVHIEEILLLQHAVRAVYMHPLLRDWVSRLVAYALRGLALPLVVRHREVDHLLDLFAFDVLISKMLEALKPGENLFVENEEGELVRGVVPRLPSNEKISRRERFRRRNEEDPEETLAILSSPASTRAAIALQQAARAHALRNGRAFVLPSDVKALFGLVADHRVKEGDLQTRVDRVGRDRAYHELHEACYLLAPPPTELDYTNQT